VIRALYRWFVTVLAVALAAYLLDGITYESYVSLGVAALVLGLLNMILRPILTLLSLPLVILSLGLFLFVINAITLWVTGLLVSGFDVVGFWSALLGGLIISLVNLFIGDSKKRSKVQVRMNRGQSRKAVKSANDSNPPPGKGPIIDI